MQIKRKQQTPHFLTQILYSQERFDYIHGCYTHLRHLVLDLTREHIKTKEDIEAAFHALNLCSQEQEELKSDGRIEGRANQSK